MEMFRNGEKRRITQLQYTGWPDHGVNNIHLFLTDQTFICWFFLIFWLELKGACVSTGLCDVVSFGRRCQRTKFKSISSERKRIIFFSKLIAIMI